MLSEQLKRLWVLTRLHVPECRYLQQGKGLMRTHQGPPRIVNQSNLPHRHSAPCYQKERCEKAFLSRSRMRAQLRLRRPLRPTQRSRRCSIRHHRQCSRLLHSHIQCCHPSHLSFCRARTFVCCSLYHCCLQQCTPVQTHRSACHADPRDSRIDIHPLQLPWRFESCDLQRLQHLQS